MFVGNYLGSTIHLFFRHIFNGLGLVSLPIDVYAMANTFCASHEDCMHTYRYRESGCW